MEDGYVTKAEERVRVGVLFGGPSAEHDVSCASALSVIRALGADRYQAVAIGITSDGGFTLVPQDVLDGLRVPPAGGLAIDDRLTVTGGDVELRRAPEGRVQVVTAGPACQPLVELDVMFPVLHGPFGEDGVIQGFLEALGVPYVGCGVLASAVGMNKVAMKRAFAAEGLPIVRSTRLDEHTWRSNPDALDAIEHLNRPLFVKPANMGSSIGISRVGPEDDLREALEVAFGYDSLVIVEEGVTGREVECSVLGGTEPEASIVGEVNVVGGWFDYQQKYYGTSDPMTVPADLPTHVADEIRQLSVRAFQAINGWGLARVDFLYDEAAGQVYLNEVNTLPGFTAHSMYPKLWAAAGLSYPELIERLIGLAFERAELSRRRPVSKVGDRAG
jgi:D-alanine-D-alanine ligase